MGTEIRSVINSNTRTLCNIKRTFFYEYHIIIHVRVCYNMHTRFTFLYLATSIDE